MPLSYLRMWLSGSIMRHIPRQWILTERPPDSLRRVATVQDVRVDHRRVDVGVPSPLFVRSRILSASAPGSSTRPKPPDRSRPTEVAGTTIPIPVDAHDRRRLRSQPGEAHDGGPEPRRARSCSTTSSNDPHCRQRLPESPGCVPGRRTHGRKTDLSRSRRPATPSPEHRSRSRRPPTPPPERRTRSRRPETSADDPR